MDSHAYTPIKMSSNAEADNKECVEQAPLLQAGVDPGPTKESCWSVIQYRHILTALGCGFGTLLYLTRVGLSIAVVAMVNSTSSVSGGHTNASFDDNTKDGEFSWSERTQTTILGSYYFGYVGTQIVGGWLSDRVGGKLGMGLGMLASSALYLLIPVMARVGPGYIMAIRVLQGLFEGLSVPAVGSLFSTWYPKEEIAFATSFFIAGQDIGAVVGLCLAGTLCHYVNWKSVFYIFGASGCVWVMLWMRMVYNTPEKHPRISEREKRFIQFTAGQKENKTDLKTPWRHIVTSPAVLAVAVAHFCNRWGYVSMCTCLPMYMRDVLHFDVQENGLLSSLPFAVSGVLTVVSGRVSDHIIKKGHCSVAVTRKLVYFLGEMIPGGLLVCAGYTDDRLWATFLLTAAIGIMGMSNIGYTNVQDIAPLFAGTVCGIINTIGLCSSFVWATVVGELTDNNPTRGQWLIFFYLTTGVLAFGVTVFALFGKGEQQWWARAEPSRPPSPCEKKKQDCCYDEYYPYDSNGGLKEGHICLEDSDLADSSLHQK